MKNYKLFLVLAVLAGSFFVASDTLAAPVFYKGSFPVTKVICGDTYTFDVPGYTNIWLKEWKNGSLVYNNTYSVPSVYTSVCGQDEGTYSIEAYMVGGFAVGPGDPLGSTTFIIDSKPTSSNTTTPPDSPKQGTASTTLGCSLSVDKNQIKVGESATFSITSTAPGYKIYWFGTKDGTTDVNNVDSGFTTNKEWLTDPYPTGSQGSYVRWFEVHEFSPILNSNVSCTSNTVSFSVLASNTLIITRAVPPTLNFTPNGGTLTAGKDSWTLAVSGIKVGDKVSVRAWKDGTPAGSFDICTVQSNNSPIAPTSCSSTVIPTEADAGSWEYEVSVNNVSQFARGSVKFMVIKPAPVIISKADLKVGPANSPSFIHTDGPITVNYGDSATFSWALSDSGWSLPCTLSDAPTLPATKTGTVTLNNLTYSKTYTMECGIAGIPYHDSVTVNVNPQSPTSPSATPSNPSSPTNPTAPTQPSFTFSHNNATLVAGHDSYTFTLEGGKLGDKLTVNAVLTSLDDHSISKGILSICTVTFSGSCVLSRTPPASEIGSWEEDVYINGEFQEKIRFTVVAAQGSPTFKPVTVTRIPAVDASRLYDLEEISDGDIIRGQGDIAVWIVKIVGEKRFKRWLFGPQIFQAYGHLGFDKVKNVTKETLSHFDTAVLIRREDDEKVYELTDFVPGKSATRRWIPSAETFLQRGFDFDSVNIVNDREFNFYKEGASLPVSQKWIKGGYFTANLSEAMAKFLGLKK